MSRERTRDNRTCLPSDLPRIIVDAKLFGRVLTNLISNALKFNRAGGKVVIIVGTDAERGLIIEILDSGVGIAEPDMRKAMAPFGQVDGGLARKYEGRGTGLPLATAAVELTGARSRCIASWV